MGRAKNKVAVTVVINQVPCTVPLNLCQVCQLLFDESPRFQLETTTQAAIEVARTGLGL